MDGVYDCDPLKNPDALLHRLLSYGDVRTRKLGVMDETAITLCKENGVPVVVFNLMTPGNILRAVTGDTSVGTTVCDTLVSFAWARSLRKLLHVFTSGPCDGTPSPVRGRVINYVQFPCDWQLDALCLTTCLIALLRAPSALRNAIDSTLY